MDKFTVFEHETLLEGRSYAGREFTRQHHEKLQAAFSEKDFPYYSLIRSGVRFCQYVGVMQVGRLQIEVLPKAENNGDEARWREMLIGMLHAVDVFDVHAPSSSDMKYKFNSILDLYFRLFVDEVEKLLHKGLVKRYHLVERNAMALKGAIKFSRHLSQNLAHQERFFVRHTIYSNEHPLNAVLYKTIRLLERINTNHELASRIGALLLNFPEMPAVEVNDDWFEKLRYTRNTLPYRKAIEIARLLLLRYHPDLVCGKNDVLALMFDMNLLWEQFIYKSLRNHVAAYRPGWSINAQGAKSFWRRLSGRPVKMRPDIVFKDRDGIERVVLDTKWKLASKGPTIDDLRQMYVYSKFHSNARTALVYPGDTMDYALGHFMDDDGCNDKTDKGMCGILTIAVRDKLREWQSELSAKVYSSPIFDLSESENARQ